MHDPPKLAASMTEDELIAVLMNEHPLLGVDSVLPYDIAMHVAKQFQKACLLYEMKGRLEEMVLRIEEMELRIEKLECHSEAHQNDCSSTFKTFWTLV
jgi:hypothetical protein